MSTFSARLQRSALALALIASLLGVTMAVPGRAVGQQPYMILRVEGTPAYQDGGHYIIAIYSDLRFTHDVRYSTRIEHREGKVGFHRLRDILDYALEMGFFDLKDRYDVKEKVTREGVLNTTQTFSSDPVCTKISIKIRDQEKSVENCYGGPPPLEILSRIITASTDPGKRPKKGSRWSRVGR